MNAYIPQNRRSRSGLRIVALMLAVCAFVSGVPGARSSPLTVKELEFLVRQKTPDAEIVREATSRRLMVPLDSAAIRSLKKNGASNSLISKLSAPGVALDPAAAATEARRQAESKARVDAVLAEDAERRAMRDEQWRKTAERLKIAK